MRSTVSRLTSSEKASPLMFQAWRTDFSASRLNASLFYQPAVADRSADPGRSQAMPIVAAPDPKAETMRAARL
jgi:hypothetical protein